MKFTAIMLSVPFAFLLIGDRLGPVNGEINALVLLGAMWLWLDIPVLGVYWLVRVARRAWRAGERA